MTCLVHLLRTCAGAAIATVLAASLTACAGAAPAPCPTDPAVPGLAIAAGGHANSPRPAAPPELNDEIMRIVDESGPGSAVGATIVRIDGEPAVSCVVRYDSDTGNIDARTRAVSDFTTAIGSRLANTTAATPESNPLESLARAASAARPGGTVVLIDSGLQTVAPLDFRQPGLFGADIDTIVAALGAKGMLPDLSDRRVILSGIGFTAAPQAQLNNAQRSHMIELWRRIAMAGGAQTVVVAPGPSSTKPVDGLPPVAVVEVPAAGALILACNTESILPDDGPVGFVADSTEFADPRAAREALTELAGWLDDNPRARGHITGSIAHYGTNAPGGLSESRAYQVRDTLIDLGSDPAQISADGVGWGPFPSDEAPPDDASDPLNRRVLVELSCR
jgi:OmpA-OmpF porin, OOP family